MLLYGQCGVSRYVMWGCCGLVSGTPVFQEWSRRRYTWKCLAAVVCGSCSVLLELLDFPPVLWAVDAHALWHLSTVPIPLLWYRCV